MNMVSTDANSAIPPDSLIFDMDGTLWDNVNSFEYVWNKGLEKSEASKSGLFLALEPVFGILLAVLVLGEKLNFLSIIGIVLVILSATICMILPKQES